MIAYFVKDCKKGFDEKACRCPVCTCSDENDFLIKCLNDSDENCPNATDIKTCENPIYYWIWIVIGIIGLIILLLLPVIIWYCCKKRSNQNAGMEES